MAVLTLSKIENTGDFASTALFQTNVLQSANTGMPWFADDVNNPIGYPTTTTHEALVYFGVATIRFPGGATKAVFSDGMMIDGLLPENVVNILTYGQLYGISVNMVVPVDTPDGMVRAEFLSQMSQFAAAVELQFPGVVTSYELGNEYWGGREPLDASLEAAYGANAASVALALSQGMTAAGYDADVFLQASGNLRGAYGNDSDLANGAIQQGVETVPGAKDVIDGVVRNNYWRDPDLDGFENSSGVFAEDRGLDFNLTGDVHNWEYWLDREVLTLVGEYNINRNIGFGPDAVDMGVHGASYLLEHMTNMIDAGVDMAFAWSLAHNTQNALIFRDEEITTASVHGLEIVTNSTRAAILDLMRQTVASHELIDATWSFGGTANDVEVTLFEDVDGGRQAGEGERIVFLSSRSPEAMSVTVDLTGFVPDCLLATAISVFYEDDGGHQRDAVLREVPLVSSEGSSIFELDLRPYEVMQLTFICDATDMAQPDLPEGVVPTQGGQQNNTGSPQNLPTQDSSASFDITFDYRFDTVGFFNDPARRAALEEAARLWEEILTDEFDDIPAGISFTITNPSNGTTTETVTLTEPVDDLIVFVGARNLPGSTLAMAGPSGYSASGDIFASRISDNFRGQGPVTDFEPWAGTIVFDTGANWSYDISGPISGLSDFISTAMHEIGHILGFGTSSAFDVFNQGGTFVGPNTLAVTGGLGVPLSGNAHVLDGFLGDSVLMDPTATAGSRKMPTDIDKAMLADIGWEIDGFIKQGTTPAIATDGPETIFGSILADTINGLRGNDQIQGNAGDDILRGGPGRDVIFGQAGRDTFALAPGDDQNEVMDFDLAHEVIRLLDSGFSSVEEALAAISKPFSNVSRITLSDGSYMDVFHSPSLGTPLTAANFELRVSSAQEPTPGDDIIMLVAGNEIIDGLEGADTIVFGTTSANISIVATSAGGIIATDRNGLGGTDSLANIEVLQFTDRSLLLDDYISAVELSNAQFTDLAEMYVAYFNRAADAEGLYFWADKFADGLSLNQIAEYFFDQVETRALYPDPDDTTAFVTAVYANVLGRAPDPAGFAFWADQVSTGKISQGAVVLEIIKGAKAGGDPGDVVYLLAKAELGLYFSAVKGLSDPTDATQVMQVFGNQASSNTTGAKFAIDDHFEDATQPGGGELTLSLVGVVDDPFIGVL